MRIRVASSKGPRSPLSYVTRGRIRRIIILNRSVLTSTLLLMIFYRIFVAKHSNELFSQPIQSNQIGNFLITTVGKTTSANVIPNMNPMGKLDYCMYRASVLRPIFPIMSQMEGPDLSLSYSTNQMRGNNRDQKCPNTVRSAERHLRSYLLYLEYPLVTASRTCMANKGILDDLTRCLFSLIVNLLV